MQYHSPDGYMDVSPIDARASAHVGLILETPEDMVLRNLYVHGFYGLIILYVCVVWHIFICIAKWPLQLWHMI